MSEEQGGQFLSKKLSLISINAPDASGNGLPDDVIALACRSLSRLTKQGYRDNLREWIEDEAARCSCFCWRCESLPPPTILQLPDLLEKLWGSDRLLAYDIYRDLDEPSGLPLYESFLEKLYASSDRCLGKADDLIREYLEKEKALISEWEATEINNYIPYYDDSWSATIQEYLSGLLNDAEKERHPFLTYAVAYLTKEAELMMEWLRKGYEPSDVQYDIMIEIRNVTLELAMLKGNFPSVHTAAVLLGITKEVEFLLERARNDCCTKPTKISTSILGYSLEFLTHELCLFESDAKLTPKFSDDVTSTVEANQLTGDNTESPEVLAFWEEQSGAVRLTRGIRQ